MKITGGTFTTIICFLSLASAAQTFELDNPQALFLSQGVSEMLTTQYWHLDKSITEIRGHSTETSLSGYIKYDFDGTFNRSGSLGTWRMIDDKYINHQLYKPSQMHRYNFGGIYCITAIDDTTLVLNKLLTSTHDMKRTIFFTSSPASHPNLLTEVQWFYDGPLDETDIDSIRNLTLERAIKLGFPLHHDTIFIQTPDSAYSIIRNIEK